MKCLSEAINHSSTGVTHQALAQAQDLQVTGPELVTADAATEESYSSVTSSKPAVAGASPQAGVANWSQSPDDAPNSAPAQLPEPAEPSSSAEPAVPLPEALPPSCVVYSLSESRKSLQDALSALNRQVSPNSSLASLSSGRCSSVVIL